MLEVLGSEGEAIGEELELTYGLEGGYFLHFGGRIVAAEPEIQLLLSVVDDAGAILQPRDHPPIFMVMSGWEEADPVGVALRSVAWTYWPEVCPLIDTEVTVVVAASPVGTEEWSSA